MIFGKLWRAEWRARRNLEKVRARLEPELAQTKGKSEEKHQAVLSEFFFEKDRIEQPVKRLKTQRWLEEAETLGVLTPAVNDQGLWERSQISAEYHLTNAGIAELRRRITKEREERTRYWTIWLRDIAAPITGLVWSLIGLVAALRACGK